MSEDGKYILWYDSTDGIKACFSDNSGGTWSSSGLIWARDAKNAIMINDYLFFIAAEGIAYKKISFQDLADGMSISMANS
jgi:hypothetical protein